MGTLILTTNDCSAGRLKDSKAAERVIALCQRLVEGPLPNDEEEARFFGSRELDDVFDHWQDCIGLSERRRLGNRRPSLVETCQGYDRIEIWTDPDPNSYLILLQLIGVLESHPEVLDRLSLAFPPGYVGELSAAELENTRPLSQPLTSQQLDLASRAWSAYRSGTPEALLGLLKDDLAGLTGLRAYIVRILSELPAAKNGLSASEAQLLALIKSKFANHETVFSGYLHSGPRSTLDYWEVGRRIVSLSRGNPPVVIGVEEDSFSLDLHKVLGQLIEEGRDDLCKYIVIDRWLGNVHLTPDHLWRWDAARETIVDPR
jgi:hypothetical protein